MKKIIVINIKNVEIIIIKSHKQEDCETKRVH